jgi:hypothetical protein
MEMAIRSLIFDAYGTPYGVQAAQNVLTEIREPEGHARDDALAAEAA